MSAAPFFASDRVLERLYRLHPKKIDLSLSRVERLLERLGNPHLFLPPVIHVAGTNGKGSTIAIMRAALERAGYRVHAFTKPHLVRFHERIRVAGRLIEEEALLALLEECERANAGEPITYFEITTAAALLAFSRAEADIVLLETGLGGRLDATNVIPAPAVVALTPISLDHQEFLGSTLSAIAAEKAGILKKGRPAVVAPQPLAAQSVIAARARAVGAPLFRFGREWVAQEAGAGMRYKGERWQLDLPRPSLLGPHQIVNAGTAIAALERLEGFAVSPEAIGDGLLHIEWPARLERLARGPLLAALPEGWEVWLDGGHNPGAGKVLAEAARLWRDRPLHLVVGMLKSKDVEGFLAPLASRTQSLMAVGIPGEENAFPPEEILAAARALGIDAERAESVAAAVARIAARGEGGRGVAAKYYFAGCPRILICGSLHLAGRILAENG